MRRSQWSIALTAAHGHLSHYLSAVNQGLVVQSRCGRHGQLANRRWRKATRSLPQRFKRRLDLPSICFRGPQCPHLPVYDLKVQQALFLAWSFSLFSQKELIPQKALRKGRDKTDLNKQSNDRFSSSQPSIGVTKGDILGKETPPMKTADTEHERFIPPEMRHSKVSIE